MPATDFSYKVIRKSMQPPSIQSLLPLWDVELLKDRAQLTAKSILIISIYSARCHHRRCLNRRAQWARGPNVCSLCTQRPQVFPDPPYGQDGPTGWYLEASRLCGLRAQTGTQYHRRLLLELDKQPHSHLLVEFCIQQDICTAHHPFQALCLNHCNK